MAERIRRGTTYVGIPARAEGALSGTEFMQRLRAITGEDIEGLSREELSRRRTRIEELVYQEIASGNVPDFVRRENFREITLEREISGRRVQATIRVCTDYFAIGSNEDYVRIPLSPLMAQRIADRFGWVLPTTRIVDVIDDEAKRTGGELPFFMGMQTAERVTDPRTGRPTKARWSDEIRDYEGKWMMSPQFAEAHDHMIREAIGRAGNPRFLRSGHKKDVVYDLGSMTASQFKPCVVIYHRTRQPVSGPHEDTYYDYSHGIRFIDSSVDLTFIERDGTRRRETRSVAEVLRDPQLYSLLGRERMDIDQMYRRRRTVVPQRTEPPPAEPPRQRRERQAL